MIDLHAHILPGVDDGARTLADAREMARVAAAEGVRAIAATPHVRRDHPTSAEAMERGVETLREDFRAEGIDVEVLPGGELDLEWIESLDPGELRRYALGGGRHLLLEVPYHGWPRGLEARIARLRQEGLAAVLAHPERNETVREQPEWLAGLRAEGALVQVTAASLDGRLGRRTQAAARRLVQLGLVDVLASDAHHPELRAYGLVAAAAALRDPGLARHLTVDVPAAVVAGEEITPETRGRRQRFALGRLRNTLPW